MGKKAGKKIFTNLTRFLRSKIKISQFSGTPYQHPIQRENLFIMILEATGEWGREGNTSPSHCSPRVTSPQPLLLGEMQCWAEFQLKFTPGISNHCRLISSRLEFGDWLEYFQCFYHNSASWVRPSLMTVWKLTEKMKFNWEVDLGLSLVGSLMHRLSSYCILQCSICAFPCTEHKWLVCPTFETSTLGSTNYYKGQMKGHMEKHNP